MNAPLLEEHLRTLKLPGVLANYRRLAETTTNPVAYLSDLMSVEIGRRHENGVRTRIAAAHFPTLKTFDGFDFTAQPDVPKMKLLELADGRMVREARNVVLYGPPGTGKTHSLIAIGLAACTHGYRSAFHDRSGLTYKFARCKARRNAHA